MDPSEKLAINIDYPNPLVHGEWRYGLKTVITRDVINPVANEDVHKLRAFSLKQPQFPYWRSPLPVTFQSLPVVMMSTINNNGSLPLELQNSP